jgi:hypothetical protein
MSLPALPASLTACRTVENIDLAAFTLFSDPVSLPLPAMSTSLPCRSGIANALMIGDRECPGWQPACLPAPACLPDVENVDLVAFALFLVSHVDHLPA